MEKFIQSEVKKLINDYIKYNDPKVLDELKQFIDHIPNMVYDPLTKWIRRTNDNISEIKI